MKKYICEFIGTLVLVLFGCGTAVFVGCDTAAGLLTTALAFGLSIVAMAYVIGNVSGCHVNPAVSLACLLDKRMSVKDFVGYVVAQVLGAIAGSAILYGVVACTTLNVANFGANGFGDASAVGLGMFGALVVELVLTFVFVYTILGVTDDSKMSSIAGVVIGLTLTFVHILGISLTGTSVNPARSLSAALFSGTTALSQVWVFIVAPLVGAALAAWVYGILNKKAE